MAERLMKPKSIRVGPLMCRPHRAPLPSDPRWSWRITTRGRGFLTVDSGRWTEAEVQRRAAEIIARNEVPSRVEPRKPTVPLTVADLVAAYAEATYRNSKRHAPSTLENVKRSMNHLRRIIGDVPLAGLTRDTVARYVREREAEGRASSTIIKEWVMLAQCWKYGRECVWVTGELPGHNIKVVAPVYNHRTPSEVEVERVRDLLVTQANSRSNGAHWPWVSLAIIGETGARVGAIEKLRVRDFDADGARLTLQGKVTEKLPDGRRTIPIQASLVTTLREWLLRRGRPGPDERLVGVKGKLVRSRGRDKLVAACEELGIEPFTWHGVRRRVVRRLRREGVSVTAAAAYLGHSPLVMLRLYDEIDDDDLEDEMAKVWKSRDG